MVGMTHAKIVETRWGQGLAFLNMTEDDVECLTLQLWAPLAENGEYAKLSINVSLPAGAPDDAHRKMWEANKQAVKDITAERFESVMKQAGVAEMLDASFARQVGDE